MSTPTPSKERSRWRLSPLWFWVTGAFVALIGAWSTLIYIAGQNPVETINVEPSAVEP